MRRQVSVRMFAVGLVVAVMASVAIAVPVVAQVVEPRVTLNPGDPIQAGVLNQIDARTRLSGADSLSMLRIRNTDPAGQAAEFIAEPGVAPFVVNRNIKVKKLNADQVDGLHGSWLTRAAHTFADNVNESVVFANNTLNAADILDVEITAPVDGTLLMWASTNASLSGTGETGDGVGCRLLVDIAGGAAGQEVAGSGRVSRVSDAGSGHTDNDQEDCGTSGALDVAKGTHTVRFHISGRNYSPPQAFFAEASLQVLFVPYNGTGGRINVP